MRRSVRIAACNRRAWLCNTLLRANNMYHPLLTSIRIKEGDIVFCAICSQLFDHALCEWIAVRLHRFIGWHDVIYRCESAMRILNLQASITQHSESLRTRHLVNQVRANQ